MKRTNQRIAKINSRNTASPQVKTGKAQVGDSPIKLPDAGKSPAAWPSLTEIVRKTRALPLPDAIAFLRPILTAMDEAEESHDLGIAFVHLGNADRQLIAILKNESVETPIESSPLYELELAVQDALACIDMLTQSYVVWLECDGESEVDESTAAGVTLISDRVSKRLCEALEPAFKYHLAQPELQSAAKSSPLFDMEFSVREALTCINLLTASYAGCLERDRNNEVNVSKAVGVTMNSDRVAERLYQAFYAAFKFYGSKTEL